MKKLTVICLIAAVVIGTATAASAAGVAVSIGIRETGGTGPAFDNGGAAGSIEWVNQDGQSLTLDGTWQLFSFTPSAVGALTGFTGDGILDVDWATLEHIRVLNADGIINPIRLWVDDVTNTDSSGSPSENFDGFAVGDEVIFQEPTFSGSTSANLVAGGGSAVDDSMAFSGTQSYQMDFQFVDNDPTRWVRLTTFSATNVPNPLMHVRESLAAPTISFYAKGIVVPEPSALALMALVASCLASGFFRKR